VGAVAEQGLKGRASGASQLSTRVTLHSRCDFLLRHLQIAPMRTLTVQFTILLSAKCTQTQGHPTRHSRRAN
jgi:hypothetical protein